MWQFNYVLLQYWYPDNIEFKYVNQMQCQQTIQEQIQDISIQSNLCPAAMITFSKVIYLLDIGIFSFTVVNVFR